MMTELFNFNIDHTENRDKFPYQFGDYVLIEQKRYGAPNENYLYRVIDCLDSNCWIDSPRDGRDSGAKIHNAIEPIVAVICCGVSVSSSPIERYRIKDVKGGFSQLMNLHDKFHGYIAKLESDER